MAASVQEELARMRIILQDLEGRLEAGESFTARRAFRRGI